MRVVSSGTDNVREKKPEIEMPGVIAQDLVAAEILKYSVISYNYTRRTRKKSNKKCLTVACGVFGNWQRARKKTRNAWWHVVRPRCCRNSQIFSNPSDLHRKEVKLALFNFVFNPHSIRLFKSPPSNWSPVRQIQPLQLSEEIFHKNPGISAKTPRENPGKTPRKSSRGWGFLRLICS